jgi:ribosomal protein S18 acetylase RimI-like enzyme
MPHSAPAITIRRARPDEATALSALALRSKASHGYDETFMAACVAELTVPQERIRDGEVWVAEGEDGCIAGFFEIAQDGESAEVIALFVEPGQFGRGIGQALWNTLEARARAIGASFIAVDSDPHAVGFYRRCGCHDVGARPSLSIPGRMLPHLRKALD